MILNLPPSLLDELRQLASDSQRSVEEEALDMLATAVSSQEAISTNVSAAMESLQLLDDQTLWQAARRRLPDDISEGLEILHLKRQRVGLSDAENGTLSVLLAQYERNLLIRAQAVALLKQRGHDVSELIAP